jgi:hypothetical protein
VNENEIVLLLYELDDDYSEKEKKVRNHVSKFIGRFYFLK